MSERYYVDGAERGRRVHQLFARVAGRYDIINDIQSLGRHRSWKRWLVARAVDYRTKSGRENLKALDLCCGTGDVSFLLAKEGFSVHGVDFSEEMLAIARERAQKEGNENIRFTRQDVLTLDEPDASYDVITCAYGLRNLADIPGAIRQMNRLLVPGGLALILEFGKPSNPLLKLFYRIYLAVCVPVFGLLSCRDARAYSYILESLDHYPAQQGVDLLLKETGFIHTGWDSLIGGTMTISYAEKNS